jgi:serine/threonine protein kinase
MAIEQYRQYIRQLLSERAQRAANQYHNEKEYEVQAIFDAEHDHYQLLHVGWRNDRRQFGCILHLDIKNGKIWIQQDGTEIGIANQLVELGVPPQDIILAFHEPEVRQYTDFGTADSIATVQSLEPA